MEAMKNIIAEFTVTIPKTAKTLAKFVAKDNLRPLLQYVVIMPGKGIATATDAHILQTVAIDARGEFAPDTIAYIDAKTFAKLAGHEITVSLTEEEREVIEVKTYRQFGQAQRQEYKVRRVLRSLTYTAAKLNTRSKSKRRGASLTFSGQFPVMRI